MDIRHTSWGMKLEERLLKCCDYEELAFKSGLGLSTVQGYRSDPTRLCKCKLENLYKLMSALGVTFDD